MEDVQMIAGRDEHFRPEEELEKHMDTGALEEDAERNCVNGDVKEVSESVEERSTQGGDDEDDEEEEICRICRCGREEKRPLYHPCVCTGSIKFVHEDCLLEWLNHSSSASGNRSKCELCGHKFRFTPVYEPGAPNSLSVAEFAHLSLYRGLKLVPFVGRVIVVALTWGVFIPIATCVMFRILSLGKLDRHEDLHLFDNNQGTLGNFQLRLSMALDGGMYTSWGVGVCASAAIFLSFLTLISVVDFVREHDLLNETDEEAMMDEHLDEHDNDEAARQEEPDAVHIHHPANVPLLQDNEPLRDQFPPGRIDEDHPENENGSHDQQHDTNDDEAVMEGVNPLELDGSIMPRNSSSSEHRESTQPNEGPWIPARRGGVIDDEFEVRDAEDDEDDEDEQDIHFENRRVSSAVPGSKFCCEDEEGEDGDDSPSSVSNSAKDPSVMIDSDNEESLSEMGDDIMIAESAAIGDLQYRNGGNEDEDEPIEENMQHGLQGEANLNVLREGDHDGIQDAGVHPAHEEEDARHEFVGEEDHVHEEPRGHGGFGFFGINDEGMDDFMGDDDDENHVGDLNVALDELLGLRGPSWVLFHNVMWLLTFNGLYLCVALFAPTTVGAVMMSMTGRVIEHLSGYRILSRHDEGFLLRTLHRLRIKQASEEREKQLFEASQAWPLEAIVPRASLERQTELPICTYESHEIETKRVFLEELRFACLELTALLIGYVTVACSLGLLYLIVRWLRDHARNRRTFRGYNSVTRVFRFMSRTFKVVIIVFLKMGLFPVLLGALLEFAGRGLVNLGPSDRYSFAIAHPVFAVMILWVAGITHMLVITVIVLELRDVLHPEILHGIIRPKNGDEGLLRSVLEESIARHLRRMALSCAIYTFLVFAFIYAPVRLVEMSSFADMLPFTPTLSYTVLEVQLPIELLCIHIGVLSILEQGKDVICDFIDTWFHVVCDALGLSRYLLAIPKPELEHPWTEEAAPAVEMVGAGVPDAPPLNEDAPDAIREHVHEDAQHEPEQQPEGNAQAEDGAARDQVEPNIVANENDPELEGLDDLHREMVLFARTLMPRIKPTFCWARVLVLSALAWVTCLITTCIAVGAPCITGRMMASLLQLPLQHEPLIYGIGCLVLWGAAHGAWLLELHRAPSAVWSLLQRIAVHEGHDFSFRASFEVLRGRVQWLELVITTVMLHPWLMGTFVQLNLLYPAQHPDNFVHVAGENLTSGGSSCASSVGPVLWSLTGNNAQLSAEEVLNSPRLAEHFSLNADPDKPLTEEALTNAVDYAQRMLYMSASPMHEWTVGFVVTLIIAFMLLAPEAIAHFPTLQSLEENVGRALEHAFRTLDCSELLHRYARVALLIELAAVFLPCVFVVLSDFVPLTLSGYSLCETYGFIQAYRHAGALLAFSLSIPYFAMQAHRTWQIVHDALRDERYLIGKRLHNMEERQKKYAQRRSEIF